MDKLNNALTYAERGYKLFPCSWNKEAERHNPMVQWGENSSSNPDILKDWAAKFSDKMYYCVALQQSGLTVIDVDNKKGKNGSDNLFDLELSIGESLSNGFTVRTPSNGYHYYFKGRSSCGVDKLGKGIDTPVMVPLPGSIVSGKGTYRLVEDLEIPILPEKIKTLLGKVVDKSKNREKAAIPEDLEHHIEDARGYLISAPVALQLEGGDATAYEVACRVRDFGISEGKCIDLMLEYWYPRCEPDNKPEFVVKKVRNAYNYANSRAGERMPEADFKPIKPPPENREDRPLHISEYKVGEAPPRCWLIKGWIPVGEITSLYGSGGLGKSLLAMQLGLAVASGETFLDIEVSESMPVLYVSCEDTKNELHRRLDAIRLSNYGLLKYDKSDLDDIPYHLWSRVGLESTLCRADNNKLLKGKFYTKLSTELSIMGSEEKLLILDTLADFFAGNENDKAAVNGFIKYILGSIKEKYNCTILLLAHPSKSEADSYSGNTAWNNSVRSRMSLTDHDNENLTDYRYLINKKANYAEKGGKITIKWEKPGIFVPVNETDIIDDTAEYLKNKAMEMIVEGGRMNKPWGLHANHMKCILPHMQYEDDSRVPRMVVKDIIGEMLVEGCIENVSGESRGNGLWPM